MYGNIHVYTCIYFKPNKKIILRGNVCLYFNVIGKKEKNYVYGTNLIISVYTVIGINPILFACMVIIAY